MQMIISNYTKTKHMAKILSRRHFTRVSLTGSTAFVALNPFGMIPDNRTDSHCIRLEARCLVTTRTRMNGQMT